ncbi:MAG: hypothetical protein ACFFFC_10195 [Candidatus Thorarchaeota archaeon]
MSDPRIQLREMVENNISSIQLMSDRLGVEVDKVASMLNEMVTEGSLEGKITLDGLRFFRKDVEVSKAPKIEISDEGPAFLRYDSRPGRIIAIIGLVVVFIGMGVSYFAAESQSLTLLNQAIAAIGIGILLMIIGGYQVSRRPTPM